MTSRILPFLLTCFLPCVGMAADGIKTKTTHAAAYGPTKNAVTVDAAKDLPRYPAVAPKDAVATWQVKKGFHLELVANEPQVRDPIAVCFDERGRMFVCEMIDYSEMRDVTPHLGRISMLEDKDGDGHFETSTVFADDLPWPTGLIWANGGLFVGATPDIWRFEDKDGDGKAEVREKVYTGFGTGLKILNVQGLMNSFQWGQDNRVHVLAGGGNRGKVQCLKKPELAEKELGGSDFWFDPLTYEFGLEAGGAQYGMSFDNYGRKFGCSNSDHLQYWISHEASVARNPYYSMPSLRTSIAADGGAAEVFRLSPDEPWRIIRTRWRIAGVVKGVVEGGGRVSGYFTGATGTTIYRGDAYGTDFLNNSFSGDAGGQLVHRKVIRDAEDGLNLVGERPADERGFEFAASKDTWVRVVNFANAPDGCLYVCDMYREVIEHPWSVPDEIKKHLDLNNGNDRGRIYRITPDGYSVKTPRPQPWAKASRTQVALDQASTEDLAKTLDHPNGWHRDTASRLLFERKQPSSLAPLQQVAAQGNPVAKLHAMQALHVIGKLDEPILLTALKDNDATVRERALKWMNTVYPDGHYPNALLDFITGKDFKLTPRISFQLALTLGGVTGDKVKDTLAWISRGGKSPWLVAAIANGPAERAFQLQENMDKNPIKGGYPLPLQVALSSIVGARNEAKEVQGLISLWAEYGFPEAEKLAALGEGLRRAGSSLTKADTEGKLQAAFNAAKASALDAKATDDTRLRALTLLGLATPEQASAPLQACLKADQSEKIQVAALKAMMTLNGKDKNAVVLAAWSGLKPGARAAVLNGLLARDDGAAAVLEAMSKADGAPAPKDLSASQIQALIKHKTPQIAGLAKTVLASVIPPSREEVTAKFKPAVTMKGDAARGQIQYLARCLACHKAGGQGIEVGPDLITVKTKGREALLAAILEPSKEVASQFIAYTVTTKDGQTLSGVITKDDASSLSIKIMGGIEQTVQRSHILGTSSAGQSLMPEGLEAGMSVQDMADLVTFIEQLK